MHPTIREFPSARFYENRLEDGCSSAQRPPVAGFLWPDWDKPVSFVPVHGSEIEEEAGSSRSNMDEAAIVIKIVNDLLAPGDISAEDIGVISPYAGQVRLIRSMMNDEIDGLEIKSVDGYQGVKKRLLSLNSKSKREWSRRFPV